MVAKSPAELTVPPTPVEIRVEAIAKSFGEHVVLRNISLEIARGQIVAIVGASGSGKTVFLDILTGLINPDSGRVLAADHSRPGAPLVDLWSLGIDEMDNLRMHWSVVFQRNALFSGTVFENIALWLREHTDMTEDQIRARVRESLQAAALDVDDVINKEREELSGGMAKRVAIARAIAVQPSVLFYDEPTTGLDPVISAHIHDLIWANHHEHPERRERTTVIVTHDKDLLRRLRPRVVMLHHAGTAFDGSYEAFTESENAVAFEYLRAMPVLQACEIAPAPRRRQDTWV